jgi:uncharacterized DUF497 family protein
MARAFPPEVSACSYIVTPFDGPYYRGYNNSVDISFDPAKRARPLAERGLDFADAGLVFAGVTSTDPDTRHDYGEDRYITAGYLHGRRVVLVWTPRDNARRIISMRYAHADEEKRWTD